MNNYFLSMLVIFFSNHCALCESPETEIISFQTTDAHGENKEGLIQEVLALQSSLIVNNQTTIELPTLFQKNGFLTIRMTHEYLMQVLFDGGIIITAHHQEQLVGYIILNELGNYFSWLRAVDRVEIDAQWSIDEIERYYIDQGIKILDQIAVATPYAKHGIGRQLVMQAKQWAPRGLSTDILYKPFTNHASLAFFSKQGFTHIATVYTLGKPPKRIPHEIYIEVWQPEP